MEIIALNWNIFFMLSLSTRSKRGLGILIGFALCLSSCLFIEQVSSNEKILNRDSKSGFPICQETAFLSHEIYSRPVGERDRLLIQKLEAELKELNGPGIEEIFDGKIIKDIEGGKLVENGKFRFILMDQIVVSALMKEIQKRRKPNPSESVDSRTKEFLIPQGKLVATDRGEWGGALVFVDETGEEKHLLRENVKDIVQTPFGIIVVAGLAHLESTEGKLYELIPAAEGLDVRLIADLQGDPYIMDKTNSSVLLFGNERGSFLLSKDGVCALNALS